MKVDASWVGAFGDDRNWARRSVHGRHVGICPSRLDWVAGPLGGEEEVQVEVEVAVTGNQLGLDRGGGGSSRSRGSKPGRRVRVRVRQVYRCATGHLSGVDGNTQAVADEGP